jgi:hypothetical protein
VDALFRAPNPAGTVMLAVVEVELGVTMDVRLARHRVNQHV